MVGGFVSLCFSNLLLSWKNLSSVFATFHLVLADRRATARTTTFVEPRSIQTKKKFVAGTALSVQQEQHFEHVMVVFRGRCST